MYLQEIFFSRKVVLSLADEDRTMWIRCVPERRGGKKRLIHVLNCSTLNL